MVEEFWALKDITTISNPGDRVGLIGRNGAGQSTGLKILSRITELTTGRVTIDGRVASRLKVGTGVHAELTGREHIVLNGAIRGMMRYASGIKEGCALPQSLVSKAGRGRQCPSDFLKKLIGKTPCK